MFESNRQDSWIGGIITSRSALTIHNFWKTLINTKANLYKLGFVWLPIQWGHQQSFAVSRWKTMSVNFSTVADHRNSCHIGRVSRHAVIRRCCPRLSTLLPSHLQSIVLRAYSAGRQIHLHFWSLFFKVKVQHPTDWLHSWCQPKLRPGNEILTEIIISEQSRASSPAVYKRLLSSAAEQYWDFPAAHLTHLLQFDPYCFFQSQT
jgi:hypothetical protein